jgi:biopolymer transport protein ExbB
MMSFALYGAGWVLWLLVAMSVGCVAISIERVIYLARNRTAQESLRSAMDAFLKTGDASALDSALKPLTGLEARVLHAGAEMATGGTEAVELAMSGIATSERIRMERGLSVLATVGSNAPFVGLFGTVLGIIQAFHDLAQNTSEASEAVMAGISEALVATAVGLMVAIPAVVLYNIFSRTVRARLARTESLANLLAARVAHGSGAHGG